MKKSHTVFFIALLVVYTSGVELRLRNGELHTGTLMSEKGTLFILQTASGPTEIRKESVVAIDGVPYSSLRPHPEPSSTIRPLGASSPKKSTSIEKNAGSPDATIEWVVRLKSGSEIRGKPIRQNRRLLVLTTKSKPITIFKNVIAAIDSTGSNVPVERTTDTIPTAPVKKVHSGKTSSDVVHRSANPPPVTVTSSAIAETTTDRNGSGDTVAVKRATASAVPETARPKVKSRIRVMTLSGETDQIAPVAGEQQRDSSIQTTRQTEKPVSEDEQKETISVIKPLRTPGMGVSRGSGAAATDTAPAILRNKQVASSDPARKKTTVRGTTGSAPVPSSMVPLPPPLAPENVAKATSASKPEGAAVPAGITAIEAAPNREPAPEPSKFETVPPLSPAKKNIRVASRQQPDAAVKKPETQRDTASKVKREVSSPEPPMDRSSVQKRRIPRSDGKKELTLFDGTVFVGNVTAENDRRIVLDADGASLTIFKHLIKTIDGKPVTVTESEVRKPVVAQPGTGTVPVKARAANRGTARGLFRAVPVVTIPEGCAVEQCVDSLKYRSDWKVRARAARYIGAMGPWGVSAAPALADLMADTMTAGEEVPVWIDSQSVGRLLAPGLEAARALAQLGTQGENYLLKACTGGEPLLRQRGVFGLGNCFQDEAVKMVTTLVHDPDPNVRRTALGSLRMNAALPQLLQACKDTNPGVRSAAVQLLGRTGVEHAVTHISAMKNDKNVAVRKAVAEALRVVNDAGSVEPLKELSRDRDFAVRVEAVRSLGTLKDTGTVPLLIETLKDKNFEVRAAAVNALGDFRDSRSVPSLYASVKDQDKSVRALAKTALKKHTELPLLIEALDDESPLVRMNASYLLWLLTGKDLGQDREKWETWAAKESTTAAKGKTVVK